MELEKLEKEKNSLVIIFIVILKGKVPREDHCVLWPYGLEIALISKKEEQLLTDTACLHNIILFSSFGLYTVSRGNNSLLMCKFHTFAINCVIRACHVTKNNYFAEME